MDNNGFIIISENHDHTGRFFGQIDGTIMDSLVQDRIYKKVAVYDYQGSCSNSKNPFTGKGTRLEPTGPFNLIFKFVLQTLVFLLSKLKTAYGTAFAYSQEEGMLFKLLKIKNLMYKAFRRSHVRLRIRKW